MARSRLFAKWSVGIARCSTRTTMNVLVRHPELIKVRINQDYFPPGPKPEVENILTFIDVRGGCAGKFQPYKAVAMEDRLRILERLNRD
jgi:hypothetical protein